MSNLEPTPLLTDPREYDEPVDRVSFDFSVTRRDLVQALGAGLLIMVTCRELPAQVAGGGRPGNRGGGGGGRGAPRPTKLAARLHIGKDGTVTVLTGKVECGQGARAQLAQAAAEELRLPVDRVKTIMADTATTPDDGITAGSRTTPSTVPAVRAAAAAARDLLVAIAAKRWNADPATLSVSDGKVADSRGGPALAYVDLTTLDEAAAELEKNVPADVSVTKIDDWKTLGTNVHRPNGHDLVTGRHHYPSDVTRPGMLYGRVLRPPTYNAKLASVDLAPAKAMKGVVAVQDGSFVGVAAPTSFAAELAINAVAETAKWETAPHPSSKTLGDYLRGKARGGLPKNPFAEDLAKSPKSLRQGYFIPYVQHAPMEPRAAVAEWENGKLTVWTATQNPFGVRGELVRALRLTDDKARVIVPDFGGGFGGKHSGECAVEAARLALAVGKPVSLRWTRQEEFTWAYFRPAGVMQVEAGLDDKGMIDSWHFLNVNSGPSSIETPYKVPKARSQFVQSEPPLRHGSYRALAATANTFARECAMDELAELAGRDPLAFRVADLENARLRAVLEEAAKRFDWVTRAKDKQPGRGVGLACGTEKGSYVATCVEIAIDPESDRPKVLRIVQAYECGGVMNPQNVVAQNEGAIIQALGPALREEVRFEDGRVLTDAFSDYAVPRLNDVPKVEVHVLNRTDLPSVGAGETPLIAIAPAIANAVFHATGRRVRALPIRVPKAE